MLAGIVFRLVFPQNVQCTGADPSIMKPIKSVYFLEQEVRGMV